jgi:hypothetical protein
MNLKGLGSLKTEQIIPLRVREFIHITYCLTTAKRASMDNYVKQSHQFFLYFS